MDSFHWKNIASVFLIIVVVALALWGIFYYERPEICHEVRDPDGELIATICGPGD